MITGEIEGRLYIMNLQHYKYDSTSKTSKNSNIPIQLKVNKDRPKLFLQSPCNFFQCFDFEKRSRLRM